MDPFNESAQEISITVVFPIYSELGSSILKQVSSLQLA